jgi:hypothetical protein
LKRDFFRTRDAIVTFSSSEVANGVGETAELAKLWRIGLSWFRAHEIRRINSNWFVGHITSGFYWWKKKTTSGSNFSLLKSPG